MVVFTPMVSVPIVGAINILMYVVGFYISEVLDEKHYFKQSDAVRIGKWILIAVLDCIVGWNLPQFIFAGYGILLIAYCIDILAFVMTIAFLWHTVLQIAMKDYDFDRTGWVALFTQCILAVLLLAHLFFSTAAICHWDWAFDAIVDHNTLLEYHIAAEDYSINEADREEQDFWNSQFQSPDLYGE